MKSSNQLTYNKLISTRPCLWLPQFDAPKKNCFLAFYCCVHAPHCNLIEEIIQTYEIYISTVLFGKMP